VPKLDRIVEEIVLRLFERLQDSPQDKLIGDEILSKQDTTQHSSQTQKTPLPSIRKNMTLIRPKSSKPFREKANSMPTFSTNC